MNIDPEDIERRAALLDTGSAFVLETNIDQQGVFHRETAALLRALVAERSPLTKEVPPYRLPSARAASALSEHLSRLPKDATISIEGFRVTTEELHGLISHADAHIAPQRQMQMINLSKPEECYRCHRISPPIQHINIASNGAPLMRPICEACALPMDRP